MSEMMLWNILAMIVLAFPCSLILKASWDGIFSGLDPKIYLGLFMLIGIGYSILLVDVAHFREEGKGD